MKSALLHKRAFTGYPNEMELLEAGGDRLFEVDSLRQPGQRMLVALAEDGTVDYPVYDPGKKKVKWKFDDRFGKKFKSEVKKHMGGEVAEAETPKEEEEATNDPKLRKAAAYHSTDYFHPQSSFWHLNQEQQRMVLDAISKFLPEAEQMLSLHAENPGGEADRLFRWLRNESELPDDLLTYAVRGIMRVTGNQPEIDSSYRQAGKTAEVLEPDAILPDEYKEMKAFMNSLGWYKMGGGAWYPPQAAMHLIRIYPDGWTYSWFDTTKHEGDTLEELKNFIAKSGLYKFIGTPEKSGVTFNVEPVVRELPPHAGAAKKCRKCHKERTLSGEGLCHECEQNERGSEEKTSSVKSKKADIVHKESDIIAQGYTPLDIPAQASMPTWGQMRKLHRERNLSWEKGIKAFRTEEGWKFYQQPDAVSGFVEEGMLPKRSALEYQCPFCKSTGVELVGIFDNEQIFECPDCGRKFPLSERVDVPERIGGYQPQFPAFVSSKSAEYKSFMPESAEPPARVNVHDLKPLVDSLRDADALQSMTRLEYTTELVKKLIDAAKQVGARDLVQAGRHYLATLGRASRYSLPGNAGGSGVNPIPARTRRALDRAQKLVESAYVHFVR
jgi:hypothetical protein